LLPAWLLAGFISSLAFAVPVTTNYQGYLENTDGEPLDATVNMTFALYATAEGGSALWTETHQNVEVTDGVFSLILGNTTSFDDDSLEGKRYLGVTVGSDPEMAPRQQLTSAFFAMRAGVADSVKADSVETEAIADGAVTADKIAPQTITGDKIANLSGHNVTELDDVADAGSGKIISDAEREKLEGLTSGSQGSYVVVKANGVEIGQFLTLTNTPSNITILNPNGYIVSISAKGQIRNDILEAYYTTPDCSGVPYAVAYQINGTVAKFRGNLIYIEKTATASQIEMQSLWNGYMGNDCYSNSRSIPARPLIPNNPTITGVSSVVFSTPITIEQK
jgi:hypothetical protein